MKKIGVAVVGFGNIGQYAVVLNGYGSLTASCSSG